MCQENPTASNSNRPRPPSQAAASGVDTGGSRRSSGITSHSRRRGTSSLSELGASEMKISGGAARQGHARTVVQAFIELLHQSAQVAADIIDPDR